MDNLSQLESHLWESANILRGPVDAADFKTYVFPLLFFKRISDVHDEEYKAALAEAGRRRRICPDFRRIIGFKSPTIATGTTCGWSRPMSARRSKKQCAALRRRTRKPSTAFLATPSGQTRIGCLIRCFATSLSISPPSSRQSSGGAGGCSWPVVRIPDQEVRRSNQQESRRVLHPAPSCPFDGQYPRPQGRRIHLRSRLRHGWHVAGSH